MPVRFTVNKEQSSPKCVFTITAEAAWKPKTCFFCSED